MSDEKIIEYSDNPDFNQWLIENYFVEIEEYEFSSSVVLYKMSQQKYTDALARYAGDPKVSLSRIEVKFPNPIAYYFYQATNNYQNDHHRLDLLKSCWESIVFFLYGLAVGEARHRKLDLKSLGIKCGKYWSDKLFDRLTIIENILDYATKSGIAFGCSGIIPIPALNLIKKLNQERNGFEHASAKTSAQQQALYKELFPQLGHFSHFTSLMACGRPLMTTSLAMVIVWYSSLKQFVQSMIYPLDYFMQKDDLPFICVYLSSALCTNVMFVRPHVRRCRGVISLSLRLRHS